VTSRARLSTLACAALLAGSLTACGDETTFTADELVAEVNDRGAQVRLGEQLTTAQDNLELYALRLAGASAAPGVPSGDAGSAPVDVHGGGTLTITEDDDAALAEYERCESAVSLICFRAANAVLIFEGGVPNQDLARIESAVQAMADGDG
jgi:hypothetical protein